ncbi:3-isopropylmalate dehydratase small subunit 1 [Methylobacterium crusticola]|uniref:3-isopropylmalate dehydratase n=1 Tax=Methylobacterium crusticola TaxID=1697972 RepID=A0ABQ4R9F5_9HYPH|nr:3-isopropylmalate dehydratase small subunit [Methylobacterium crusticola]GJD53347.1 3-isopropylmalate dehydratase small subunit 1 [Methylobacterium crusticola]
MRRFTRLEAVAAPILLENIDTDVIIRIERLVGNGIRGTLAPWCFGALRYLPDGSEDPGFVLNRPPYREAGIIIAGRNFGCGSSREGAVWSLQERGVTCVIAPSFGDIFFNNCFQNGILPVVLDEAVVSGLAREVEESQGAGRVTVDLEHCVVVSPAGRRHPFQVEARRREALLQGLDEIGATRRQAAAIEGFQARDRQRRPWVYVTGDPA